MRHAILLGYGIGNITVRYQVQIVYLDGFCAFRFRPVALQAVEGRGTDGAARAVFEDAYGHFV
ncbi:hypothetical protein D9M70_611930 [compost metagenome]